MKSLIYQYLNLLNRKYGHKGFTQTELLLVIVLIGIVPTFITSVIAIHYQPTFKLSSNTITSPYGSRSDRF
ncbi:type II secretion system protein [Merismopedia glauca]|uniref:type II secretion system protein n=1 Tax=Merismopedia glauca TaxID=292586 RepID=UPI0011B28A56|nr:hypothetical protein [Merismopedia glauca]